MDSSDKIFIKDLTLKTKKGYLCVRVMRKWPYDGNIPGGPVIYLGLILADEQGSSIYAQIPEAEVQRLGPQLALDTVYTLRKFNVRTAKPSYVPLNAELMIQITSFTTITPSKVPAELFPPIVYHIIPFKHIKTSGEGSNRYIDVMGIVTAEGPLKTACPKGRDFNSTLKEITIKDLSGAELTVTLWEDQAQSFHVDGASPTEPAHSVVALFCGCLPKRIFNKTQVNAGNACRWYLNPNIKEAQPFYDSLKTRPIPIERPPVTPSAAASSSQPKVLQHKTLAEMNALDPYEFPENGCKCTATITEIPPEQEWWYMGCEVCKKRLRNCGGTYFCAKCKCGTAIPLYKLSFVAADETDDANFFCYDVVGRQIIRRNCDSLLRATHGAARLPDLITRAVGRTFTFAVGLADQSYSSMDTRVYSVDNCVFRHDAQALNASPSSALSEPAQLSSKTMGSISAPANPSILDTSAAKTTETIEAAEIVDMQPGSAASVTPAQTPPPPVSTQETPEKLSVTTTIESASNVGLPTHNIRKRLADDFGSNVEDVSVLTKDVYDGDEGTVGQNKTAAKRSKSAPSIAASGQKP